MKKRSSRRYTMNLRLLLLTLAILAVTVPVSYLWYRHRVRQTANALLSRAEQLDREHDWAQSTSYYQRYLLVVAPEDPRATPAMVKMAEAFAKLEPNPSRLRRLNNLLYQTLGRAPDQHNLRLKLAENLLLMGALEDAEIEAKKLEKQAPKIAHAAGKVIALSVYARARVDGGMSIPSAVNKLKSASADLPADVELVSVAADALREHLTAVESENFDPATEADQMMDRLVDVNPQNVEALLARYRYRVRYKLVDADRDLEDALKVAPDNVDVLLLSALSARGSAATRDQRSKAKSLLRRAIELEPADSRGYLALATLLDQSGDRNAALELLQSGRVATENNFDLGLALANTQISAGKIEAAKQTHRELDAQSETFLVRLDPATRTQVENQLRLVQARVGLVDGSSQTSILQLQSILLESKASSGGRRSPEWVEATGLLAQAYVRAGQWDRASEHWGDLAEAFPGNTSVVCSAAEAYLRAGNPREAVELLDGLSQFAEVTSDMAVQLLQAHFALQMHRPAPDRNWSEFETALKVAKASAINRFEVVFAEANYYLVNGRQNEAAVKLLRDAEPQFPDQVQFWRNAARAYQELGETVDRQRALEKHRELATAVDQAALEAALLAREGKYAEAEKLLASLSTALQPAERRQIDRLRIETLAASNRLDEALQFLKELLEENPQDSALLPTGIDIALAVGDLTTAEKWESELRTATNDGPDAVYAKIRRMLLKYGDLSTAERQELGRSIIDLRGERQRWYPAVALAGRFAQLQGDSKQALADYELAIQLGDRRPFTLQQVFSLLYAYGRLDEAQGYLSQLTADQPADPSLGSIAVELAIRQDRPAEALELARQAVERFPEDAMRRVYLANLLMIYAQPEEAAQVLQEAVSKFTTDSQVWTALVTALARAGQIEEAQRTLTALVANSALPQEQRQFIAAQGYEILKQPAEAKKHYEMALEQQPQATVMRLKYAKFLASNDPSAARDQYELVLQQDPKNDAARRELAVHLAASGQEADWTRAMELLGAASNHSASDANTGDRLRALLLSRKGRTRAERIANCQAARKILLRLLETDAASPNDLNRLLIAQIYEQEAALSDDPTLLLAARDLLRQVVDQEPPSVEKFSLYIEFLLRHAKSPTASGGKESAREDVVADSDSMRETFLADAEAQIEELKGMPGSGTDGIEALSVALTASLLQAQGRDADATEYVANFAAREETKSDNQADPARRYLTIGRLYTAIGAHAEAEKWYRRVMESNSSAYVLVVQSLVAQGNRQAALELCLSISNGTPTPEVATVIANLMTVTDQPVVELPAARVALEAAIKEHAENIQLLQSRAVSRASRGEYDEAIADFRRIVKLDPNNALALNNLATLLAEKPNQRAEALEHVQRAIDIAGPQAALLDTQGTIFLKTGDSQQAIACLEEATAGGAADARYYLHLAAAYQQARRNPDAFRMLREARAFGLEKFVLTEDDRELLAVLDDQLHPPGHAVEKQ